jgi:hypothetical protein
MTEITTPTTIIEAIQTFIKDYEGLEDNAPVWVDYLGSQVTQYSINPMPGSRIVETYIDGSTLREYPFSFLFSGSTADDTARLGNSGLAESFADWIEEQSESGNLPLLSDNKTAESMQVTNSGYLEQEGESQTGIYAIQCKLVYTQEA